MKILDKIKLLFVLAWRNIWRQPKRTFILIACSTIGMLGILLAMASLNGFLTTMFDTGIKSGLGHVQIRPKGYLETRKSSLLIESPHQISKELKNLKNIPYAPRFEREGFIKMDVRMRGINAIGVDVDKEKKVSDFHNWIIKGKFFHKNSNHFECIMGEVNAKYFEVDVGDDIVLSIGNEKGSTSSVRMKISGIFKSPAEPIDKHTILVDIKKLANLYNNNSNNIAYFVFTTNQSLDKINPVKNLIMNTIKDFKQIQVVSYQQLEPALYRMLEMSYDYSYIFYIILMGGFALILFDTILISVLERTFEIGLLRAMGSPSRILFFMILFESFILSLIGFIIGFVLGWFVVYVLLANGISLAPFSEGLTLMGKMGSKIYPYLTLKNIVSALNLGIIFSIIAGIYPAIKALRIIPVKALKK